MTGPADAIGSGASPYLTLTARIVSPAAMMVFRSQEILTRAEPFEQAAVQIEIVLAVLLLSLVALSHPIAPLIAVANAFSHCVSRLVTTVSSFRAAAVGLLRPSGREDAHGASYVLARSSYMMSALRCTQRRRVFTRASRTATPRNRLATTGYSCVTPSRRPSTASVLLGTPGSRAATSRVQGHIPNVPARPLTGCGSTSNASGPTACKRAHTLSHGAHTLSKLACIPGPLSRIPDDRAPVVNLPVRTLRQRLATQGHWTRTPAAHASTPGWWPATPLPLQH